MPVSVMPGALDKPGRFALALQASLHHVPCGVPPYLKATVGLAGEAAGGGN